MADECVLGVENRTRIDGLEDTVSEIKTDVKENRADTREIKDKLLKRPSWFVSILITAMASALTASASVIVFLIMNVKGG